MKTTAQSVNKKSTKGKETKDVAKVHQFKISGFTINPQTSEVRVGDQIKFYIDTSNNSSKNRKASFVFVFESSSPSLCLGKSNELSLNEKFECDSSWTSPPLMSAGVLNFRESINGSKGMAGTVTVEHCPDREKGRNTEPPAGQQSSDQPSVSIEETPIKLSSSAKRRAKLARRKVRESHQRCNDDIQMSSTNIQTKHTSSPKSQVTMDLLKKVEQQCQTYETHSLLQQVQEQHNSLKTQQPVSHCLDTSLDNQCYTNTRVYEVVVKQGRFDPSNLVIEGGCTVNWTVSSTVVGALRLSCDKFGIESPAIAPGCCWSCTFPIISPEVEGIEVSLCQETNTYSTTVHMEDQVFLGKCSLDLSSKRLSESTSSKNSPIMNKVSVDKLSPSKSAYCSSESSSFADSDDIRSEDDEQEGANVYIKSQKNIFTTVHEHPAVASRYGGMPPQLARVALMGSFGGGGMMSNAGSTKPLSEFKVSLPPRYGKTQRSSAWNTDYTGDEDSDSFEDEAPGESFVGELSHQGEEEDLFPTQEASKYGNLVLPSALDVSPLTSPEVTPAHSPDRRRSPASATSHGASWGDTTHPSIVAAAAAVASVLAGGESTVVESGSSSPYQNLPGLPFRMVNSSRASTRARRVRVYEDSDGTIDSDDASSLSSAATPIARSPVTPQSFQRNDLLDTKCISTSSLSVVSKDIMNDLFMANLKQDEQALEEEERNEQKVHEQLEENFTDADLDIDIKETQSTAVSFAASTYISERDVQSGGGSTLVRLEQTDKEPKKKRKRKKKAKGGCAAGEGGIAVDSRDDSACICEATELSNVSTVDVSSNNISEKGNVEAEIDIVFGNFDSDSEKEFDKDCNMTTDDTVQRSTFGSVRNEEKIMALFGDYPFKDTNGEWVSTKQKKKEKHKHIQAEPTVLDIRDYEALSMESLSLQDLEQVEDTKSIDNQVLNKVGEHNMPHKSISSHRSHRKLTKTEREVEDFFSSRFNTFIETFGDCGIDTFPNGTKVPVEVIGVVPRIS